MSIILEGPDKTPRCSRPGCYMAVEKEGYCPYCKKLM